MSIYIFTGPTISAADASGELEAVYLPPAAEGDVYRVTLKRPRAIGIIDGYFQSIPSVRHKEILWAMSQGIHVFGSASMGALRAAELAAFGMVGVGTIFKFFRDGVLEDDDEVAIVHGLAESGFQAGSEAMVNIRQTLRKAKLAGIISTKLRIVLERTAKELFYPERNYRVLIDRAMAAGVPPAELEKLRRWLPEGQVNQKREDALAMLRLMHKRLEQGLPRKTVSYSFQHTSMWESAWRQGGEFRSDPGAQPGAVTQDSLLDELRLEGKPYEQHRLMALERFFALREANRLGITVTEAGRSQVEFAFRQERGLADPARFEQWMNDNGLDDHAFDALMMDEARIRWVRQLARFVSLSCLPEQLRLSGDYPRLFARALAKNRLAESFGAQNPSLVSAQLTEDELLHWYFGELLGQPVPADPYKYSQGIGYETPDAFRRALLKEYLYRRFEERENGSEARRGRLDS